jgi:hypothetical protein
VNSYIIIWNIFQPIILLKNFFNDVNNFRPIFITQRSFFMKRLIHFSTFAFLFLIIAPYIWGQEIFVENFEYPAGDTLTDHGWTQIRSGTPITMAPSGLTFMGYGSSGIGNAALLVSDGIQEIKNTFTEQTTDSFYISYLINVSEASTNDGIYLYLGPTNISIFNRQLTAYVHKDTSNNLGFGISKSSGVSYTGYNYSLNTTYLIVMKYKFNPGDNDDEISLWVNPFLSGLEPTPDKMSSSGSDATGFAEIVLSQITASNAPPDAIIDGIRITKTWEYALLPVEASSQQIMYKNYQLAQNYPNPFNPSTTIEFSLPEMSEVTLKIYNIDGEEVVTLISDKLSVGFYSSQWDASNLPSGVYLYRLNAGGFIETKRMILCK